MPKGFLQTSMLSAYRLVQRTGLLETRLGRSIFEWSYLLYKEHLEAGPVRTLRQYCSAGTAVMDIGANIGFFTCKFADWIGPDGMVIAVEPDQDNFERLKTRLAARGPTGTVKPVHAAAAASAGRLRLARNAFHPGDHRISTNDSGVEINAVTLDSLAALFDGRRLSFIKIDVQGAEVMVLEGAQAIIRTYRPVLLVEIDDGALAGFGVSASILIDRLQTLGYSFSLLDDPGHDIEGAALRSLIPQGGYIDVLCRPDIREI